MTCAATNATMNVPVVCPDIRASMTPVLIVAPVPDPLR
jgi:hypothetical protein